MKKAMHLTDCSVYVLITYSVQKNDVKTAKYPIH